MIENYSGNRQRISRKHKAGKHTFRKLIGKEKWTEIILTKDRTGGKQSENETKRKKEIDQKQAAKSQKTDKKREKIERTTYRQNESTESRTQIETDGNLSEDKQKTDRKHAEE